MNPEFLQNILSHCKAHGGATLNIKSKKILSADDLWYIPLNPDISLRIPLQGEISDQIQEFVKNNLNYLNISGYYLGLWINPETTKLCVDIVTTASSKETAIKTAEQRSERAKFDIVGIYNPSLAKTVYIKYSAANYKK